MAQAESNGASWWHEPLSKFEEHLISRTPGGDPCYSLSTIRWLHWALTDFCEGFPDAPPESRQEVIDMMNNDLDPECAVDTKRSYYKAVSWWFSWSRANVPGCGNLPSLGRESFGRKRYRRRLQSSNHHKRTA